MYCRLLQLESIVRINLSQIENQDTNSSMLSLSKKFLRLECIMYVTFYLTVFVLARSRTLREKLVCNDR